MNNAPQTLELGKDRGRPHTFVSRARCRLPRPLSFEVVHVPAAGRLGSRCRFRSWGLTPQGASGDPVSIWRCIILRPQAAPLLAPLL